MIHLIMIVKNEEAVLERCIRSTLPFIDGWTIVDTGSTDSTLDILRRLGVERERIREETRVAFSSFTVHKRPWVDFSHNRNEGIRLAREELGAFEGPHYLLTMDADDVCFGEPPDDLTHLSADAYYVPIHWGEDVYQRLALFRAEKDFVYRGVLHEALNAPPGATFGRLESPAIRVTAEGARGKDPEKYRKDVRILSAEIKKHPDSARDMFYLAQSWRDAGELKQARTTYRARVAMGGWEEERYEAAFQAARMTELLANRSTLSNIDASKRDYHPEFDAVVSSYLQAYQLRPTRAEPLCALAAYLRSQDKWPLVMLFAEKAMQIPMPADVLFVNRSVYAWRATDEYALACYFMRFYGRAAELYRELLTKIERDSIPVRKEDHARLRNNLRWSEELHKEHGT